MSDSEGKTGFDLSKVDELVNSRGYARRAVLKGALGLGALATLGPVASAYGSPDSEAPAMAPKKGGHIRSGIGGGSSTDSLDAHLSTTETQIVMQWQLYDSLLGWDPTSKLVMLLADTYEASADAKQHTVKLKSGLTFHNGKSVTADDVIYTFQRILNPATGAIGASYLSGLKSSGIKKLDKLTVRFTLSQPNAIFYEALAYYNNAIVPVGYQHPTGATGAIGTGPWKVTSFFPGQQAAFDANPNYWGVGPYADSLTMSEFSDPTAKINALLGGTLDHITNIPSAQAATIQHTTGMQVLSAKSGAWDPFTMRIDQKPFTDVRVRQAFRLIVNRPQMITQARGGYAWLGNDMYAPYDPGYPHSLPQRHQDLAQAKSLLKKAGYGNGLTVQLVTSTAVGAADVAAAQVFAEQAKGAGVTVNVNDVDPSVFYGSQYLKWTFAQDFWATRNYLPQAAEGSIVKAPYNECHWKNAKWDALYSQAVRTVNVSKRNEMIREMETIEYNEGGYIIWSFNIALDAHSQKLQGLVADSWGANSACKCRYNLMYFA